MIADERFASPDMFSNTEDNTRRRSIENRGFGNNNNINSNHQMLLSSSDDKLLS